MTAKIEYNGQSDFSDRMIEGEAYGCFARGATGRVCLVMVGHPEDDFFDGEPSTLREVREWAESIPGGYLDY